jgi:hypothetical protein
VVEVAVGEDFSSRAEFRLEVSSVEPLGCSRSAAVPTASTHERGDVGGRHVATRGEAEAGDEEAVFGVDGESSAAGGVVEVGGEGEGEGEWYLPRDEAAYGQLEKAGVFTKWRGWCIVCDSGGARVLLGHRASVKTRHQKSAP